jgi:pyruvate/2-oxoglutarate dehydrogenase complex dihydrolipoamide acyltransferase (E2) component
MRGPTAIAMPKLGMTMREGIVVEWRAKPGAHLAKGDVLLVIESEKAEIEIEAPGEGFLRHIYVDAGATVPCGTLLAVMTETDDEPFDAEAFRAAHAPAARTAAPATTVGARTREAGREAATGRDTSEAPATPAARRLAKERDIDLRRLAGSGPGGRITREDVEALAVRLDARVVVATGVALDVVAAGSGDVIVLIPGFGTDASAFAPQIPALAEKQRVLAVNPRGLGFSDTPESDSYDIAIAAEDVAKIIGDTPAHVVGASLGAATAIELALQRPQLVRSLTLITPLIATTGRLEAVIDAWCALAAAGDRDLLARFLSPWMFAEPTLKDREKRERIVRALAQTAGTVRADVLRRWAAGAARWSGSRSADLAKISAPTLVIAAGADLLTPDAAATASAIPRAKLVTIEAAGHAVAIENPAAVTRHILGHTNA